ncbi:hypothetical protein R1flu_016616 [Riccia fluitans]|uniref:Ribosomal protein S14 n=1 Tax=Riccia fluitans TaxID=41844 RepID=A0ABD1YN70_9MARC
MMRRRNNEPYSRKGGCSLWKEELIKIRRNLNDHLCQKDKRFCCCESSLKEGFFRVWRGTNAANAVAVLTATREIRGGVESPRVVAILRGITSIV